MKRQLAIIVTAACLALAAIALPAHSAQGIGGRFEERLRQAGEKLQRRAPRSPAPPRRRTPRRAGRSSQAPPSPTPTRQITGRSASDHRGRMRRRVRGPRRRRAVRVGRRELRLHCPPRKRWRARHPRHPARPPRRRVRSRRNPPRKVGLIHRPRTAVTPYRATRARRTWRRRYRRRRPQIIMYLWVPRTGRQGPPSPRHDR